MTNLQVQASQAQAGAAKNEAAAIREGAGAKEEELKARGELTAAAKAEIDARRQSANLKDLERKNQTFRHPQPWPRLPQHRHSYRY